MTVGSVGLVWAQAANGVIGAGGTLPWHLPEDLARFKALTLGSTVVMGRSTWESLPAPVRPLPGRHNVVLSRQAGLRAPGAEVVGSIERALDRAGDVWVIGASVYAAALAYADLVVVTELDEPFEGDTVAPALGASWRVRDRDPGDGGWLTSCTGLGYRVLTYLPAKVGREPDRCAV